MLTNDKVVELRQSGALAHHHLLRGEDMANGNRAQRRRFAAAMRGKSRVCEKHQVGGDHATD